MAEQKLCDCCSKPGARYTIVAYNVMGDYREGAMTGTSFGGDFCDACRDGECDKMLARAKDQQKRHKPLMQEILMLKDQVGELVKRKDDAVRMRDEFEEKSTYVIPATRDMPALKKWRESVAEQEHRKLAVIVDDAMQAIDNNLKRQAELLELGRI